MKRSQFILFLLLTANIAFGQKPFSGMLEYSISARDTNFRALYPENRMLIYTNDTIVRQVNFTQHLGEQVTIRHMKMNKSYLLLTTDFGKFAIQSDLNKLTGDSITKPSKYHFQKKGGSKKHLGMKLKRYIVTHEDTEEQYEFWYNKKMSSKYNNAFEEIPGIPVIYTVVTPDVVLDFKLTKISPYNPNRDLFGIPSDYQRISFDDFLNKMLQKSSVEPEGN